MEYQELLLRYVAKLLVLPPAINLLLLLFALIFLSRYQRTRFALIFLAIFSLAALSLPISSNYLARQLEIYPPLQGEKITAGDYQAIVILGAGRETQALEYGADMPTAMGLQRLRYGAYLQRASGLPILVSGGQFDKNDPPEATFMASVLENDFGAKVSWRESASHTTWENAQFSRVSAGRDHISNILLVTHAWHMKRAVYSFEQAGFRVTAAPTAFISSHKPLKLMDFLPQANALRDSALLLHEMLGLCWYRLNSRLDL